MLIFLLQRGGQVQIRTGSHRNFMYCRHQVCGARCGPFNNFRKDLVYCPFCCHKQGVLNVVNLDGLELFLLIHNVLTAASVSRTYIIFADREMRPWTCCTNPEDSVGAAKKRCLMYFCFARPLECSWRSWGWPFHRSCARREWPYCHVSCSQPPRVPWASWINSRCLARQRSSMAPVITSSKQDIPIAVPESFQGISQII